MSFKKGFLFGSKVDKINQEQLVIEHVKGDFATLDPKNADPDYVWDNWSTPLTEYAGPITNFQHYLEEKISESTERLRILDVGIGSGVQWVDFLEKNNVEFWGTALSETFEPVLKDKVIISKASQLHEFFEKEYFDVIVSSFGMHDEELIGIENSVYLMKPKSEAFFKMETSLRDFKAPTHYDLLAQEKLFENNEEYGVAIKIRKH